MLGDWLDENCAREHPLDPAGPGAGALADFPRAALADAVFLAGGCPGNAVVALVEATRLGNLVELVLRLTNAGPLDGLDYLQVVDLAAPRWTRLDMAEAAASCGGAWWRGTLVLGRPESLAAWIPDGATRVGSRRFAPAQWRSAGPSVAGLGAANRPRVRLADPCLPAWPAQSDAALVRCAGGALRFRAGRNVTIRQAGQVLTFAATAGAGAGAPCDELPRTPGEALAPGRSTRGGQRRCGETLRSLGGVSGPHVQLRATGAVSVQTFPAEHRVLVTLDRTAAAGCGSG